MTTDSNIAIVGLAGRFPGARDIDQYWANLRDGVESIAFPADDELIAAGVPTAALGRPGYVKAVAAAPWIEDFDAALFGFTPREAASSDPQIRMFLECAHAAIENAGYNPYALPGTVGVYGSAGLNRYLDLHLGFAGDSSSTNSMMVSSLNNVDYVASTVAYKFNLRGPAISLSTACSSSLVAVHLACQALRNGECDAALAGGVDIEFPVGHGYQWDEGGPVSADGHVRPFDVKANGTVFGTGCGVVVLKRLSDAVADRDEIRAVIVGSAVNNDGADKAGFSAPSVTGQATMLAEAIRMAGIVPADLSYVEAHATGTPLGDPIEVAALHQAFARCGPAGPCVLSSVKGNIGHLGHAAGVASLIKAVLAIEHEQLPPTANFTEPNPKLNLAQTSFTVSGQLLAWTRGSSTRYAGVSSFGVGGTNAHVVLAEPPAAAPAPASASGSDEGRPAQIVVWSALTDEAADDYGAALAGAIRDERRLFADLAATSRQGRRGYRVRRAVVAEAAAAAADAIAAGHVIAGQAGAAEVVFAFPGQGSQFAGMGAGAYRHDAAFRAAFDECLALLGDDADRLRDAWVNGDEKSLRATAVLQPLLLAVEYATSRMLIEHEVRPAAVIGHSVGEFAAAVAAGVLSLPDAAGLVRARADAMAAAPPGAMLAVASPLEALEARVPAGLSVAVVNGDGETVLAGPEEAIEAARLDLLARDVACTPLRTSGAFHSPLMTDAAGVFLGAFDGIRLSPPAVPLYSAAAGGLITAAQATDPEFWAGQMARPIRFDLALSSLLTEHAPVIVEVGPGDTLVSIAARQSAAREPATTVTTLPRRRRGGGGASPATEAAAVDRALAALWTQGVPVRWELPGTPATWRRVPAPGYPYQRRRHWVPALPASAAPAVPVSAVPVGPAPAGPEEAPRPSGWTRISWREQGLPPAVARAAAGDCVVVLPGDRDLDRMVVAAVARAGFRPVQAGGRDAAGAAAGPRLFVHAGTLAPAGPLSASTAGTQLEQAFYDALAFAQQAVRHPGARLLFVTSRSADVTGAEPADPVKAVLHGLAASIDAEAPHLGCRVIDLAQVTAAGAQVTGDEELAREIGLASGPPLVALRGPRRWVRGEAPADMAAADAPALRRGGVYLITGGRGGLGMAVARALAGTGLRPRLALLGRTEPAAVGEAGEVWRARVAELEELGAEVLPLICDVTDRRATRRALDTVTVRLGPPDGVFHLAGVAGDGLFRHRAREQAAAVLAPKVAGTLILAEELSRRGATGFFVCFSSRAALDGLVGGADYAAANAFQDAYMCELRRAGVPALSVNWPSWAKTGMAADHGVRTWSRLIGPENCALLDEHRIDGLPVLPGTAYLDFALRAYRDITGGAGPVAMRDVVFHRVLADSQERSVVVRLHPDGRFECRSRPAGAPLAEPVVHATGHIHDLAATPGRADLAAIRARVGEPAEDGPSQVFTLGPRWQNVRALYTLPGGNPAELLAELSMPPEFAAEAADSELPPTLLDSATGALRRPDDGPFLPFLYARVHVYSPLPSSFFSHVRRQQAAPGTLTADVDLIAEDGTVLATVEGFTMRAVAGKEFVGEAVAGEAGAGEAGVAPGQEGLDPEDGARLMLTLLNGRHTGQVAVPSAAPAGRARATGEPGTPALDEPVAPATRLSAVLSPAAAAMPSPAAAVTDRIEEKVGQLWAEAIGLTEIDTDADFFEDLGGTSLAAVMLMTKIRDVFAVELSIAALFDYPTLAGLSQVLRDMGAR